MYPLCPLPNNLRPIIPCVLSVDCNKPPSFKKTSFTVTRLRNSYTSHLVHLSSSSPFLQDPSPFVVLISAGPLHIGPLLSFEDESGRHDDLVFPVPDRRKIHSLTTEINLVTTFSTSVVCTSVKY